MSVNYPAGSRPKGKETFTRAPKKEKKHIPSAANRGMSFEADINETNDYYREMGLALITKRPTPINVVQVDYTHGQKITHAYFEKQSTTDYNGVIKGRYVDFEAKSTRNKTSFPLSNIAPQQVRHLRDVKKHGGIAFFLIYIHALDKTFLLDADYVCDFYEQKPRKSIPFKDIEEHGHLVKEGYRPRYDFLPIVLELFFK